MPKLTLREKFEIFHEENPDVYRALVRLAAQLKERGHHKIGIKMLFEVVRWQSMLKTTGDAYKLNNNHAPFYARLIMEQEPDMLGFFDLRTIHS